ncbi:MAG: hypothetical protein EOO22_27690 [Comamonadaceae bacterium]|nr:MAG: hypothetical protein EOO22_27690 [Comamonadaceae bacterium]
MRSITRHLCLLPLVLCIPAWAAPEALAVASGPRGQELRDAVAAHRMSGREQIRHDEAVAGRRLTPAERAELREQLRQQWLASTAVPPSAETQPAERILPMPVADATTSRTLPAAARSQRP